MKAANRFAGGVFVLCALLQLNDPDPVFWVFIYGLAGCACMVWDRGGLSRVQATLLSVIALFLLATIADDGTWQGGAGAALRDWEMMDQRVEPLREMGGLLLFGAWMAVLAWRRPRLS